MRKKWIVPAFTAVCVFCIFLSYMALAVDVPDKLKDIPLYEGSSVVMAMDMGNNTTLAAKVKADAGAIAEFYKKTMVGKGWKVAFQAEQEDSRVIQFQKDNMLFHVTVERKKNEDKTTYSLMMISQ